MSEDKWFIKKPEEKEISFKDVFLDKVKQDNFPTPVAALLWLRTRYKKDKKAFTEKECQQLVEQAYNIKLHFLKD